MLTLDYVPIEPYPGVTNRAAAGAVGRDLLLGDLHAKGEGSCIPLDI